MFPPYFLALGGTNKHWLRFHVDDSKAANLDSELDVIFQNGLEYNLLRVGGVRCVARRRFGRAARAAVRRVGGAA